MYFHFDWSTHIILLDQQMQCVKIRVKGGFRKSLGPPGAQPALRRPAAALGLSVLVRAVEKVA